jgi:hypothetical protein
MIMRSIKIDLSFNVATLITLGGLIVTLTWAAASREHRLLVLEAEALLNASQHVSLLDGQTNLLTGLSQNTRALDALTITVEGLVNRPLPARLLPPLRDPEPGQVQVSGQKK